MKTLDGFSPEQRRGKRNTSDNKDKLKQVVKSDLERGDRIRGGKKSLQDIQDEKALDWFSDM